MDDQADKIRNLLILLNNEETSEIANFLLQLPLADFRFWGGLIKEAYQAKLQEGSGVLEALKKKEVRKETANLTTEVEKLTKKNNELTIQLDQRERDYAERIKILEKEKDEKLKRETENLTHEKNEFKNEVKHVRKGNDDLQVKY